MNNNYFLKFMEIIKKEKKQTFSLCLRPSLHAEMQIEAKKHQTSLNVFIGSLFFNYLEQKKGLK